MSVSVNSVHTRARVCVLSDDSRVVSKCACERKVYAVCVSVFDRDKSLCVCILSDDTCIVSKCVYRCVCEKMVHAVCVCVM